MGQSSWSAREQEAAREQELLVLTRALLSSYSEHSRPELSGKPVAASLTETVSERDDASGSRSSETRLLARRIGIVKRAR